MIASVLTVLLAFVVAAVIYYFLKKSLTLLINSIVGITVLYGLNYFDIFTPAIPIDVASVLVCAFGGLPGLLIVVVLHLAGITI
jgi:inhibitor of the pro-sigma K processing machinery